MTWIGFTSLVVLPSKKSFDSDFYIKNVLRIVKRDGTRLIEPKFIFQQDGAKCHTSEVTINELKKLGISYIGRVRWPPNSLDMSSCGLLFFFSFSFFSLSFISVSFFSFLIFFSPNFRCLIIVLILSFINFFSLNYLSLSIISLS